MRDKEFTDNDIVVARALCASYGEDFDDMSPKNQHMRVSEAIHHGYIVDKNGEMKQRVLKVSMPDGTTWVIPASLIARKRAEYYAQVDVDAGDGEFDELYGKEYDYSFNDASELLDWAGNNMNWSDVKAEARQVRCDKYVDYDKEWMNAEKEIMLR